MLWTALVAGSVMVGRASAACSRALLTNITQQYIQTQTSGKLSDFTLLGSNVSYSENDEVKDIKYGYLSTATGLARATSYHDTTACSAAVEWVTADSVWRTPHIAHTRMLTTDGKVTTIESVVTRPGDWAFNATGYLYWSEFEHWAPIPEGKRDSREVIKAAGDAYFDRFDNASVVIPMNSACSRLEGGSYTARGNFTANTCDGYPSTIKVTNRRYVIDEEMGVVDIFIGFPKLDRMAPDYAAPDSHIFRVEGGKIRYIHTVSHCLNNDCGLNRTSTFGMENA